MPGGSGNAQVIANYAAFVQGNYFSVAARALFLWDYFVTFDREVQYVWSQKLSAASGLFIVNRYVNLVITILELIEQAPFQTPQPESPPTRCSCPSVVRVLQSLLIFATFIVALFASLRVYAIWSRDWRPALPILLLALITPAANMYLDIIGNPIPAPHPSSGCAIQTNIDPTIYSHIVIAERITTTLYDALVLLFTFLKTLEARKSATRTGAGISLVALLLRDGEY
ncbi:hypothetical protein BV20DRAFT_950669 [Pilatotrama ljubarskyi]|nr:hypothetical protein BV20DRAFT_950669 [Pilatotrama ljubarskyi]